MADAHLFCPGYRRPYATLVAHYPGEDVYPPDAFRTEWGPIFHRGRLDGTARILVLGQDPAAHESIARRILVGEAGQRAQGLLARLGIDDSYVFVNTFLYSVYGQSGGEKHIHDEAITAYRNRWLDTIADHSPLQAVLTLGHLADEAFAQWPGAQTRGLAHAHVLHPTYPESSSASGHVTLADAMKRLCESWNEALATLTSGPSPLTPDTPRPLVPYGDALTPDDVTPIPERDLPAGLPGWMRDLRSWARRTGTTPEEKRATITVTVLS